MSLSVTKNNNNEYVITQNVRNDITNGILYTEFKNKYENIYGSSFSPIDFIKIREKVLLNRTRTLHNESFDSSEYYASLPWYKRIFRKENYISDTENSILELYNTIRTCENGINTMLSIHAENSQRMDQYEYDYLKYKRDLETYNSSIQDIINNCTLESARRVTLASNRDGECSRLIHQDYGDFGKVDQTCTSRILGICFDHADICGYINPASFRTNCINLTKQRLTQPVEPTINLLPMPTVTCQICPNIVSVKGENILTDTKINQMSNCLIEQKEKLNALENELLQQEDTNQLDESTIQDESGPITGETGICGTLWRSFGESTYKYIIIAIVFILLLFLIL